MSFTKAAGSKTGRIELLDVLRGVAIFGTLGTNIWLFSTVGSGEALIFGGGIPWWASVDSFLATLTLFVSNGKFLGMLTVLFSVGLEIQYQSARRRGLAWPVRYLWRSILLLVEVPARLRVRHPHGVCGGRILVTFLVGRSEHVIRRAMWISGGIRVLFFGGVSVLLAALILADPQALAGETIFTEEATRVYTAGSW